MKWSERLLVPAVSGVCNALQSLRQRLLPPPVAVLELVTAAWLSQALAVAASLGLADALQAGPKSLAELARDTGAHPEGIARLLRALAQHHIFAETRDGRFKNTRLSRALCREHEHSVRSFAMFVGHLRHREHWSAFESAVRSLDPSPLALRGKPFFAYAEEDPAFGALFQDAMSELSRLMRGPLLAGYDFARSQHIVDVGGGRGELLAAILKAAPHAQGVLFDLPEVTRAAPSVLEAHGVQERCRIESGSFFEAIPRAADTYLLKQVLHDWDDERATRILKQVHKAAKTGSHLLVMEMLVPEGKRAHLGKLTDLEMLVSVGGKERTREQFRALLERAGFRLERVIPTGAPISVLEAVALPIALN